MFHCFLSVDDSPLDGSPSGSLLGQVWVTHPPLGSSWRNTLTDRGIKATHVEKYFSKRRFCVFKKYKQLLGSQNIHKCASVLN